MPSASRGRGLRRAVGALLLAALVPAVPAAAAGDDKPVVVRCAGRAVPGVPLAAGPTLRGAASARLEIGTAVNADVLASERRYRDTLAQQFSSLTPENEMKWAYAHPRPGHYTICAVDRLVQFAQIHRMSVRGGPLVWHEQLPTWLTSRRWTRSQLREVLREHITTLVRTYRGLVTEWDVISEVFAGDGTLRKTLWLKVLGPEYIELAFRYAREADPTARLLINEHTAQTSGPKANAVRSLVTSLRRRGVQVDGVSLQLHLFLGDHPTGSAVQANLARYAAMNLDVVIAAMDVSIATQGAIDEGDRPGGLLDRQADVYRSMLDACLRTPRCRSFSTWGFTDAHSWRARSSPLIYDADYQPKLAYHALLGRLRAG